MKLIMMLNVVVIVTTVCHKCVSKQTRSFAIGQNDGWNLGSFISGALFLSFPQLFLNDSSPRAEGKERRLAVFVP